MRRETEFVRPELAFERDFLQVRNWWVQDKRIVGNPASIFFYLLSHRADFRVTQSKVMRDLGLGKDAYLAARRKLQAAGYLEVVVHRYAPGEVDENGAPIGGQKWTELIVCDPEPPAELRALVDRRPVESGGERMKPPALADNPPRPAESVEASQSEASAEKPPWPSPLESAAAEYEEIPRDHWAEALAEHPAPGHPPLKQDQVKQHSSSSVLKVTTDGRDVEAAAAPPDEDTGGAWFDQGTADRLARLDARLDLRELVDRLNRSHPNVAVELIDLPRAVDDVLGAAPRRVGNPVAYVASSLAAEPWRWVRTDAVDGLGFVATNSSAQPQREARRPPTVAECTAAGHRWIGEFDECCARCGIDRPNWRDDRDVALAGRATATEGVRR
ncbi:hypothetical protein [Agromyces mariniharenae]|uniref:Helix-turn-helix domain-containing protein n=1 Tax=Agromyces mariniharenae TaxID=2604423 RepID=A0A5S4UXJ8_9MICO|nr:hypothetical protein [Agromyces mariniharenae]TYL50409.1 hypothetical protein FYC51_14475 [Agromyces mariniharenae]